MPLSEEEKANLVAYLDGELDEGAAQALEAKLAVDPGARAEVEELKQAWNLLDYLPKPEPSPAFTHRTMERLAMRRPVETARMPRSNPWRWLVRFSWAAAVILLAVGGYSVASWWFKPPPHDLDEPLVQYLRLIERLRHYEQVDDLDYVRALDHLDLFGEESSPLPKSGVLGIESTGEDQELNRRRLENLAKNPERLSKLREDAQKFLTYPPERREHILKLDRDLHEEPSLVQARLENTLDRYLEWLDRLEEKERQKIQNAPDKKGRLALVRQMREREWLEGQPRFQRENLEKLSPAERSEKIASLKDMERKRHEQWQIASRFGDDWVKKKDMPSKLADFSKEIQDFVTDYLQPKLSKEEKDLLEKAQEKWPLYPQTLVQFADLYPPALPSPLGPKFFNDLPRDVKAFIKKGPKAVIPKGKLQEGSWPTFAISVTVYAREKGIALPHELWPTTTAHLQPTMKDFLATRLNPLLNPDEKLELSHAEGKWPNYPQTVQKLAQRHYWQPPWFILPSSPEKKDQTTKEKWESYRLVRPTQIQGYPELPRYKLRDFVLYDMDAKDRADLNVADSAAWQRLHEVYFQRYREELDWLKQLDQAWWAGQGKG